MFTVDGQAYYTNAEAAAMLGVAGGTLRGYIRNEVLPDPGKLRVGLREQRGFSTEYIEAARRILKGDA